LAHAGSSEKMRFRSMLKKLSTRKKR